MTKKTPFRRSKVPDVEEMKNKDHYIQILELNFDDMIPFVLSNIKKKGWMSGLYVAVNLIALAGIILYAIRGFSVESLTWPHFIMQFILGSLAGSFLIIPIHELLHGLAYKVLGARKIKFGVSMKQFMFYVTTDRFPVKRNELLFLAMLPFMVVNCSLLLAAILWAPQYGIFVGFLLLSHNLMCIGDFAISNFTLTEKGEVFTYDEVKRGKCYFYKELNPN